MRAFTRLLAVLAIIGSLGLASIALRPVRGEADSQPRFGDPLPGLTKVERDLFDEGQADFKEVEDVSDGLGPIFNATSCVECHSVPVTGGGSPITETRFGRLDGNHFDPMTAQGGSLLQSQAIDARCQEVVPKNADVVASRLTPPLFGAGLIEAIPDADIIQNQREQFQDHLSAAGRVHNVVSVSDGRPHVGRFGWKAQQALLLDFSGDAYLNEMGITNPLFPEENAPNGKTDLLKLCDTVADPEDQPDLTGRLGIEKFTNFMRLLAPPPTGPRQPQGERVFHDIGCAVCHHPAFTVASSIAAIDGKLVQAYSDFLLHDIGTGDGIAQGDARPEEIRTPALWGLSGRGPYLHDGSEATIEGAILRHDGQALAARREFEALDRQTRAALLRFLRSI